MTEFVKVYQIAKRLGIDTSVVIERLRTLGIPVRNNMSKIDASVVNAIMSIEETTRSSVPIGRVRHSGITVQSSQRDSDQFSASPHNLSAREQAQDAKVAGDREAINESIPCPKALVPGHTDDSSPVTARTSQPAGVQIAPDTKQIFGLRLIAWHPKVTSNRPREKGGNVITSTTARSSPESSTQHRLVERAAPPAAAIDQHEKDRADNFSHLLHQTHDPISLDNSKASADEFETWIVECLLPLLAGSYTADRILKSPHILVRSTQCEWSILVSFNPDSAFGEPLRMPSGVLDARKVANSVANRSRVRPAVQSKPHPYISRLPGRLTDHGWHAELSSTRREIALVSAVFEHSQGTILKTLTELRRLSWARQYQQELVADYRFVHSRCKFTDSLRRRLKLPNHCVGIIDASAL